MVLCYGICCFAMAVCGWMMIMMMGDADGKYFLAFLVDGKRQRYRSWCRHRGSIESQCRVVVKTPFEIDDFVNQMTDMTRFIIRFVGGCGMVWFCVMGCAVLRWLCVVG